MPFHNLDNDDNFLNDGKLLDEWFESLVSIVIGICLIMFGGRLDSL